MVNSLGTPCYNRKLVDILIKVKIQYSFKTCKTGCVCVVDCS